MSLINCLVMKFLASEQSWRRCCSLYECWVRLGRRWWRTCWGSARMFSNRVSSASSASCDAVGSVSWYRLSRTTRRTCASIRPFYWWGCKAPPGWRSVEELGEHHRLVNRLQRITVHSVTTLIFNACRDWAHLLMTSRTWSLTDRWLVSVTKKHSNWRSATNIRGVSFTFLLRKISR